ncbi:hypothetical protein SKAU_G00367420 [Synaphobranchus kaupii]|uniref:Uncharacterized protein n=1 Tax=Synaphobranchus kaupii TaxID=118154 RepID=A0A9Q1EFE3_SYNKA|nr:hypothetical protein SKAU_G00367420 [Synaphobranchus kaupii]
MTGLLGPALAVMNLPSLSLVVKLAAERRRRRTTTTIFQDRSSPLSPATTTQVQLIKAFEAEPCHIKIENRLSPITRRTIEQTTFAEEDRLSNRSSEKKKFPLPLASGSQGVAYCCGSSYRRIVNGEKPFGEKAKRRNIR